MLGHFIHTARDSKICKISCAIIFFKIHFMHCQIFSISKLSVDYKNIWKKKMQKLDNKKKREKKLEDNLKEIITAVRSLLFKSCTQKKSSHPNRCWNTHNNGDGFTMTNEVKAGSPSVAFHNLCCRTSIIHGMCRYNVVAIW